MWLAVYDNESTLPRGDSWQGDPSCLGEPSICAGSIIIWKFEDLRVVGSLSNLTPPPPSGILTEIDITESTE